MKNDFEIYELRTKDHPIFLITNMTLLDVIVFDLIAYWAVLSLDGDKRF